MKSELRETEISGERNGRGERERESERRKRERERVAGTFESDKEHLAQQLALFFKQGLKIAKCILAHGYSSLCIIASSIHLAGNSKFR